MTATEGLTYVEFLAAQGSDELNERIETFIHYETTLIEQIQDQIALSRLIPFMSMQDNGDKPQSVKLYIRLYYGKEEGNRIL